MPFFAASSITLESFDLPIAIMNVVFGVGGLVYARWNNAAIQRKIQAGVYTQAEGEKKERVYIIGCFVVLFCGLLLLILRGIGEK